MRELCETNRAGERESEREQRSSILSSFEFGFHVTAGTANDTDMGITLQSDRKREKINADC